LNLRYLSENRQLDEAVGFCLYLFTKFRPSLIGSAYTRFAEPPGNLQMLSSGGMPEMA